MPPALLLVLGLGVVALVLRKQAPGAPGAPGGGGPLPAQGAMGPGFPPPGGAPPGVIPVAFGGLHGLHVVPGGPAGHDVAPLPVPAPTPAPVQVPAVLHAQVVTHDVGPSGNLHIRSAPSTSGSILGDAPHGSLVRVNDPNPVQGSGLLWLNVTVEASGISGYAAAQYLQLV